MQELLEGCTSAVGEVGGLEGGVSWGFWGGGGGSGFKMGDGDCEERGGNGIVRRRLGFERKWISNNSGKRKLHLDLWLC